MKLRKTRIKKQTKANGSVVYIAEYKYGFWWKQFDDLFASHEEWKIYNKWYEMNNYTGTEKQAKHLIDFYIARVKYKNACKIENKIVSVEYENYP